MGATERRWAKELLDLLGTLPSDTTPERIKSNREKLLPYINKVEDMRVAGNKHPLLDDFWEFFHYFDHGYKSPLTIDELPSRVKDKLGDMIVRG